MEHSIDLAGDGFSPEEYADIKQCLETLLSIQAGSQPLAHASLRPLLLRDQQGSRLADRQLYQVWDKRCKLI